MSRYVGALDQGTTSTRFMVFDEAGREVARRQLEHRQIMPRPGWVEHDPIEIAARVNEVIAGGLRAAGLTGRDLAAIGITNQRETTVVWDPETGQPWHHAIVWQDTRTAAAVAALEPRRALLAERTGLPPSTYFSSTKLQWLRDQLGIITSAAEIEPLAASVPDSGGLCFVPAFSGLFAPHWRADARGAIVGLSRFHTKAHLARAALEAICFQTRDVLDAMTNDSGVRLDVLKVDGGATVNDLLMQLQADLLGVPVVRPVVSETTALGAAYAAGLAVGVWNDLDTLRRQWRADRQWEPRWSADQRDEAYRRWQKAVERSVGWVDVG